MISTTYIAIIIALFAGIGLIDGFYYHIWKFKLYKWEESRYEHGLHSARALLFPVIIYLLFIKNIGGVVLWLALLIALIDISVLVVDVLTEYNSRELLGGLPDKEYLVHIIANGLHFTYLFTLFGMTEFSHWSLDSSNSLYDVTPFAIFITWQAIIGGVVLGIVHILLPIIVKPISLKVIYES
ncbi:MAG: hypothetical protein H8E60_01720 [Candidatus Marinimicrobia bacterium]|nr:hypothetical protein [Candidatus Neomarinimicrobiota bacterium]